MNNKNDGENEADFLFSTNYQVDERIDFTGIAPEIALLKIEEMISKFQSPDKENKIWFYFPLASRAEPTLFGIVGRKLRDELKAGRILRAMPAKDGGWIIRL